MRVRVCVCVCTDVCAVVEPVLVRAPQNTAVTQDSQVTIKCSSDIANSRIKWFSTLCKTYLHDTLDCIIIYNGYEYVRNASRFSVTKENNATHVTRDLDINPTQPIDAGVYVCVESIPSDGVQQIQSAQLIVVGNYITFCNVMTFLVIVLCSLLTLTC